MSRSFLNSPACRASTKQSTKSINKIYRVTTSKRKPFGLHRGNGFSLHRIFERNAQRVRFLADLWRNGGNGAARSSDVIAVLSSAGEPELTTT